MNNRRSIISSTVTPSLLLLGFLVSCVTPGIAATPEAPDTTPQGLVRVDKKGHELVYLRPGADFSEYDQFVLIEPHVSFRKDWKSDKNVGRYTNRITDDDVAKMIAKGKGLLVEEFAAELTKGGYKVSPATGPKVLAVKASIYDLDIYAPDPDGTASLGGRTMSDGSGEATIAIELFDSVSGQLLAQAFDRRGNSGSSYNWAVPRNQTSNTADARYAFGQWAKMLVKGLERAKAGGVNLVTK